MEKRVNPFSSVEWRKNGPVYEARVAMYGCFVKIGCMKHFRDVPWPVTEDCTREWKLTVADATSTEVEFTIEVPNGDLEPPYKIATEMVDFVNPVAGRLNENNHMRAQMQQYRDVLEEKKGNGRSSDGFVKRSEVRDALRAEQDDMGMPSHKRMEVTDGGAAMPARIAQKLKIDLSDEPDKEPDEPISLQAYRKDR